MATHDPNEIDLRDYLKVLYRRRWWGITLFLGVLIITAIITFNATPIYEATAEIMVLQNASSQGLLSLLTEMDLPFAGQSGMANQVHIIKSRPTLEYARKIFVGALASVPSTADSANIEAPVAGSNNPITVEEIAAAIRVSNLSGSDLISISASSASPVQAMEIANALVEAYQQLDRERTVAALVSVRDFLSEQINLVEEALLALEEELVRFQQESGLLLEESLLISKVIRIEQLLVEARVELKDSYSKLDSINKFLADVKDDFVGRAASGEEGTPVLLEIQDKLNFMLQLQKKIAEWEKDRSQYLQEESYAQAQIMEQKIIHERQTLEDTAAKQFALFDMLPQYEELIQVQLEVTLEIEALENRVSTLDEMRQLEISILLSKSLELSRKKRGFDIAQTVYDVLLEEHQKTKMAEAAQLGNVEIINPARVPESPIRPRKVMNLFVGVVVGLFSGIGGAFLREFLDNTFHSREDVEQVLGLIALGVIPRLVHPAKKWRFEQVREDLLPNIISNPQMYQAFVNTAANFRFLSPDKPLKTILITSALPDEGKSTIAANLALALASNERRVLLIDADLRRPVLEKVFDIGSKGNGGLSDLVLRSASQEEVIRKISLEKAPPIYFLSAGKSIPNPTELLSSVRFEETLKELRDSFDTIIIDSSPVAIAVDAALLASKVDGTVLVVRAGKSRKENVLRGKKDLEQHAATLLGVILNNVPQSSSSYYGYGGYYNGYYGQKPRTFREKFLHRITKRK